MRALRSAAATAASVTVDVALPRGGRLLIAEPDDGPRVVLLLLDLAYLPSGALRELAIPPNAVLVIWGNPPTNPARRPTTFVPAGASRVSLRTLRQELACTLDAALPIAELIGYALDLPVHGAARS